MVSGGAVVLIGIHIRSSIAGADWCKRWEELTPVQMRPWRVS